jgi:hypothetical protein
MQDLYIPCTCRNRWYDAGLDFCYLVSPSLPVDGVLRGKYMVSISDVVYDVNSAGACSHGTSSSVRHLQEALDSVALYCALNQDSTML